MMTQDKAQWLRNSPDIVINGVITQRDRLLEGKRSLCAALDIMLQTFCNPDAVYADTSTNADKERKKLAEKIARQALDDAMRNLG